MHEALYNTARCRTRCIAQSLGGSPSPAMKCTGLAVAAGLGADTLRAHTTPLPPPAKFRGGDQAAVCACSSPQCASVLRAVAQALAGRVRVPPCQHHAALITSHPFGAYSPEATMPVDPRNWAVMKPLVSLSAAGRQAGQGSGGGA